MERERNAPVEVLVTVPFSEGELQALRDVSPRLRINFQAAREPKRLQEIAGANHSFDGHRNELFRSMKEGLEWIAGK